MLPENFSTYYNVLPKTVGVRMGMMFADVTFKDAVPALTAICEKITEITTLPVVVLRQEQDDLHELNARIAFQCSPETDLELLAYRPGAVRRFCEESFEEPSHSSFMQRIVQGANEPAGSQTVYLRGYIGQEPTLMAVTELALDALGGQPRNPIADADRSTYDRAITADDIAERNRNVATQMRRTIWATVVMLPVLIPLWIAGCIWGILTMPYRIWKAGKTLKNLDMASWNGRTKR